MISNSDKISRREENIEEGIARLQDNDLTIPIGDKISLLASEPHEKGQML